MNDDAQVIEEVLSGNSEAYGQLVRKYQDRLYNTIVHVAGCREEARDVVQDALVQAFVKLDTFRGNCAFYTWLFRIAYNLTVTKLRRKKLERDILRNRASGGEPLDPGESAEEKLQRHERAEMLQAALDTLPEDYRTILVLREKQGCCYNTIAEMLDMPLGTVRSRLHRARLQLREQLKEMFQEQDLTD